MFQKLELKPKGSIGFGVNYKGKITGTRIIGNNSFPFITNVLLTEGLMHNLLSKSQLSNNCYDIIFNQKSCKVMIQKHGFVLFSCKRKNNVYKIKLSYLEK